MLLNLLKKQIHSLTENDIQKVVSLTAGYSGSDMDGLIREAAIGPIRDVVDISKVSVEEVRPISLGDFEMALSQVRASVSEKDLDLYIKFDGEYGSMSRL